MTNYPDLTNNRTSILIENQLPEFVQLNHQNFVSFLNAYYEYLEQTGKLTYMTKNVPNFLNVDYVVENELPDFIEQFRKEYLSVIPKNVLADKALLTKHIKEFYSTKGTPKSFKFLFRILFDEDVDIFSTGSQILIASDGKWYQPSVIRIATSNNLTDFVNTTIIGQDSFATGVVDSAVVNFQNNFEYNELTLTNITKNFYPHEVVYATTEDNRTLYGEILSVVPGITIVETGSKYNVGDPVIITGGGGANASAYVSEVTTGSLLAIGVTEGGSGYKITPTFSLDIQGSTTPATATIFSVDDSGSVHPNTYILNSDIISTLANVSLSLLLQYPPTNNFVTYSNTGPISLVHVIDGGSNFQQAPVITVTEDIGVQNTFSNIADYGVISTFKILNGGKNYKVDDDVKFINITATGAAGGAKVASVNANGAITSVYVDLPSITGTANVIAGSNTVIGTNTIFTSELVANNDATYANSGTFIVINGEPKRVMTISNNRYLTVNSNFTHTANMKPVRLFGFMPGGFGYKQSDLPNGVQLSIQSSNGSGAVVVPYSILGQGAVFNPIGSVYGKINDITMSNFGDSYTEAPDVDLTQSGDGLAIAKAQFIGGVFKYPGRFLNEDGLLSARRYIQDSFKYNSYSYMIRSRVAVNFYHDLVYQILNPAGSNMLPMTQVISDGAGLNVSSAQFYINLPYITILDVNFIMDISVIA
jgi:hypothetical protein